MESSPSQLDWVARPALVVLEQEWDKEAAS